MVAIGDNDNDADLVKEADLGITVENARPSVSCQTYYKE